MRVRALQSGLRLSLQLDDSFAKKEEPLGNGDHTCALVRSVDFHYLHSMQPMMALGFIDVSPVQAIFSLSDAREQRAL